MRIIKKLVVVLVICVLLTISVFATQTDQQKVFEYVDPETTVVFEDETDFTEAQMQKMADSLVGIHNSDDEESSPRNLICTIIGHDLSSGRVSVTKHKVTIWNPRCLVSIYDVTACSRCDYAETVLISSFHIFCCPENLPLPENTNPTE